MTNEIYFAWKSGSIFYECLQCGLCCRGYGLGESHQNLNREILQPLWPFIDPDNSNEAVTSFFTYADGCIYQDNDLLCQIHKKFGESEKPVICQLFPFSRLVDVDGLWVAVPHPLCPWQVVNDNNINNASSHRTIKSLFEPISDKLQPTKLQPKTELDTEQRKELESRICTELDLNDSIEHALIQMANTQAEFSNSNEISNVIKKLISVTRENQTTKPQIYKRLFLAAVPNFRILLCEKYSLEEIPLVIYKYYYWLGQLASLNARAFRGNDMTQLLIAFIRKPEIR